MFSLNRNPRPDDDEFYSEKQAFDTIFTRIGVFPPKQQTEEKDEGDSVDRNADAYDPDDELDFVYLKGACKV